MSEAVYTGEDVEVVIDLVEENFADMVDVIVGVVVNKILVKTFKKTLTGATAVVAHPTEPTMCIVRLFRSETKTWAPGPLSMEVTKVMADSDFPLGKHTVFKENIVLFSNAYTKNA